MTPFCHNTTIVRRGVLMRRLGFFLLAVALSCAAQGNTDQNTHAQSATAQTAASTQNSLKQVTVPAGTEVPLTLKSAIDTKNTRVGDGVYCQTAFPVVIDNVIAIPAGTYVKGEVVKDRRAGRIKGRAEILFKFNTLIFPNGYTVGLAGTLDQDRKSVG